MINSMIDGWAIVRGLMYLTSFAIIVLMVIVIINEIKNLFNK